MKKTISILSIVMLILFLITGISFVAYGVTTEWGIKNFLLVEKSFETVENKKIIINSDEYNVKIVPSLTNKIELSYYEDENEKYLVSVNDKDNVLTINQTNKKWFFNNMFFWNNSEKRTINLKIPNADLKELDLSLSVGQLQVENFDKLDNVLIKNGIGDIKIENLEITNNLNITMQTGRVRLSSVKNTNIIIENKTGEIELDKIISDNLSVQNSTGNVSIENTVISKDLKISNKTGYVELKNVNCNNLDSKTNTGYLRLSELISNNIILEARTGNIRGTIKGAKNDYTIVSSTNTGSNNLTNSTSAGGKFLTVKNYTGNIKIEFI